MWDVEKFKNGLNFRKSVVGIHGPRQSGRTTKLIAIMKIDPDGVLICRNSMVRRDLMARFELNETQVRCPDTRLGIKMWASSVLYFDDLETLDPMDVQYLNKKFTTGGVVTLEGNG